MDREERQQDFHLIFFLMVNNSLNQVRIHNGEESAANILQENVDVLVPDIGERYASGSLKVRSSDSGHVNRHITNL